MLFRFNVARIGAGLFMFVLIIAVITLSYIYLNQRQVAEPHFLDLSSLEQENQPDTEQKPNLHIPDQYESLSLPPKSMDHASIGQSGNRETYFNLPLSFEPNYGQTDQEVKFLSRGSGYNLFLTSNELVLVLAAPSSQYTPTQSLKSSNQGSIKTSDAVLRMRLSGAHSQPSITGENKLPGKTNYFLGNDPSRWQTEIPSYSRVRYEDVYAGIDVVYYGNQRQLEYDFVLEPEVDPRIIKLEIEGTKRIRIDSEGNLLLSTPRGIVDPKVKTKK